MQNNNRLTLDCSDETLIFTVDPIDYAPVKLDDVPPCDRAAIERGLADYKAIDKTYPLAEVIAEIEQELSKRNPVNPRSRC